MKWSTLVACLIVCFSKLKGSNAVSGPQTDDERQLYAANANRSPSVAALLTTLCTASTLDTLPPAALVSIANAVSATPQLYNALPPSAIVCLLTAVAASPSALSRLSPIAVLVLLAALSSADPASISSIAPSALFPLLKTLSLSGVLPAPGSPPAPVYARLPPLPPPSRQIVYPGPVPGPMYVNLPRTPYKPPPIVIPSGPPQSIVVSFPRPYERPPPLIMPHPAPGPIVINGNPNTGPPSPPIVLPAPPPPNIYFTTHPSVPCPHAHHGAIGSRNYWSQPPLDVPKVYTLPPGVSPADYASGLLKNVPKCF